MRSDSDPWESPDVTSGGVVPTHEATAKSLSIRDSGRTLTLCLAVTLMIGCMNPAMMMGPMQDGVRYQATALSWNENKNYHVQIEFQGNNATMYFMDGQAKVLTLRDPMKRKNPKNIEMVDEATDNYWDITIKPQFGLFGK